MTEMAVGLVLQAFTIHDSHSHPPNVWKKEDG